jgi:osmotically-inducible protein OsmY
MSKLKPLYTLTLVFILTGALPGCATYGKCGFGGCPGDAEITAQVHALFDQYPDLEPANLLHLQTLDHVVYMYGQVSTELQRQTAESVALAAPGVSRVVNSIAVMY